MGTDRFRDESGHLPKGSKEKPAGVEPAGFDPKQQSTESQEVERRQHEVVDREMREEAAEGVWAGGSGCGFRPPATVSRVSSEMRSFLVFKLVMWFLPNERV
jgi:hypothetical protein